MRALRFLNFAARAGLIAVISGLSLTASASEASQRERLHQLFQQIGLQSSDSVLISRDGGAVLFSHQESKALVPASLMKLLSAAAALDLLGEDFRFKTYFYRRGDQLWVQGKGDPFLVSEEIELMANKLRRHGVDWIREIVIDGSYYQIANVPGRTKVDDPYNAPVSAVSANFNTVFLHNKNGRLISAESQTPLTEEAKKAAKRTGKPKPGKRERIQLGDERASQIYFAELLMTKAGMNTRPVSQSTVPDDISDFELLFVYNNSRVLTEVLRGALEFSNNLIANQVFLSLSEGDSASFDKAASRMTEFAKQTFAWESFKAVDGSGLSRENRLTSKQIDQVLTFLAPYKNVLKSYDVGEGVKVRAKTGTLSNVHSFAGFIEIEQNDYQFVFNFNRQVPYRFRESLLKKLVMTLRDKDSL